MTHMGTLIFNQRHRKGMTQTELAEELGFTNPQFISNIERGLAGMPVKHFVKVADLLDLSTNLLYQADVSDYKKQLTRDILKGFKR